MVSTTEAPIRLAVLDTDTGFLQVNASGSRPPAGSTACSAHRSPLDTIVAMRLNAIVLDLAVLGPQGWGYLEKLCDRLPPSASSSAPAARQWPSACAGCGSAPTTG